MKGLQDFTEMKEAVCEVLDGRMTEQAYLARCFDAQCEKRSEGVSYSLDSLQSGCYPGASVFINKLNIRDGRVFAQVDANVTKLPIFQR